MKKELLRIGAAYVRVSDDRQDEYSPDSQLKKVREFAEKEGYIIPDEYVFYDDGISGKSVKKRVDFNRMIAMAKDKSHPFDKIYVWKFSRFARNQEEAIVYKSLLSKQKVAVVSVSEPLPEGAFGSLVERIIEWMDAYYLTNLSGEVIRGMTEKATRGEPVVNAPFGYKMGDNIYLPDEEGGTADIVREMFQRFSDGEGTREIAMSLAARGVRTKRGNPPDNRFVEYILRNPCYIGKLRWTTDGSRSVSKRYYDHDQIMVIDGHHKPLVSMELWDAVQKRLDEQKRRYPKHARKSQPVQYMLKGLVRCSCCGGTLAAGVKSGKNKVPSIQCCKYARGTCTTSHSITIPKVEEAFLRGLKQAVGSKQFIIQPKITKAAESSAVDYDKLIGVEERRLARAKEAYLAGIDTIEQYAEIKRECTERIEDFKSRRDDVVVKKIDPNAFAEKVLGIVEFIEREDVTPQAKNDALRTIIEKVVYEKEKGNLAIYFHEI